MGADSALPAARARIKGPEATLSRNEIEPRLLFEDGQERLRTGRYGTAAVTFRTLIAVYPESPLVPSAAKALRHAEELEQVQSNTRIVRSLRFENMAAVEVEEIRQRFEEREIDLELEKPCTDKTLAEAKAVLAELLSERGLTALRVEVHTRELAPRSVEVTFRGVAL